MKFNIITLFPGYFESIFRTGLLGRAIEKNIIGIELINLRDYAVNRHGQVDDTPYGGGAGMVLMVEPVDRAVAEIRKREKTRVVLLTPRGDLLQQAHFQDWCAPDQDRETLTLLCGHYEGFDERVALHIADQSISIGNYVITGGEAAASVIVEGVSRLQPGFMGNAASLERESFDQPDFLEHPHYTRPAVYGDWSVPEVLLSGDHGKIEKWRIEQSRIHAEKLRKPE